MKAGAVGGIEAIMQAINKHIDNADVCYAGYGALCIMTANGKNNWLNTGQQNMKWKWTAENRVKAGASGGIEAVVKAINIHINNIGVCEKGCRALCNMTANSKNNWIKQQQQMKMNSWERIKGRSSRRNWGCSEDYQQTH